MSCLQIGLGCERQRLRDRSASDRIGGLSKSVVVQMSEKLTTEGDVVMNEKNYEMNEAQLEQVAGGALVGSESSELWKCTCRACGKMTIVSQRPTTCRLCRSTNISVAKNSY